MIYHLMINGSPIGADPQDKGSPGDLVIVWLKRRGPRLVRRLARNAPYDSYHFRALDTERVIEVRSNKVMAINKVVT